MFRKFVSSVCASTWLWVGIDDIHYATKKKSLKISLGVVQQVVHMEACHHKPVVCLWSDCERSTLLHSWKRVGGEQLPTGASQSCSHSDVSTLLRM